MNLRPTGLLAAVAVMVALTLCGCGTPAAAPQLPKAQQPTSGSNAATASNPAKETDYDKALRFVRCLGEKWGQVDRNGKPLNSSIKDPVVGEPLPVYAAPYDVFQQCKQYLPAMWPIKEDPAELAKERPFRACLREHGIDAPEPDSSGLIAYQADPYFQDTPAYRAAEQACIYLYNDPAKAGSQ